MKRQILGAAGIAVTVIGGIISSTCMKDDIHDEVERQLSELNLEKDEEKDYVENEEKDYVENEEGES